MIGDVLGDVEYVGDFMPFQPLQILFEPVVAASETNKYVALWEIIDETHCFGDFA